MISKITAINPVKGLSGFLKTDSNHVWQFSRVGGVNRVNLESGADLVNLEFLDQKLWTALSCPVHGLEIDPKTLELIDTDNDDRIRVPEILAAVKWIIGLVKNADDLLASSDKLPLEFINNESDEGQQLLASAKQILVNLGLEQDFVSVNETSDFARIFAGSKYNGDGVITEETADDSFNKGLISDIIKCISYETDRNGKPGVSANHVNEFFDRCADFSAWVEKSEKDISILPFGANTSVAFDSYNNLKSKIDDFFIRCRLSEFDSNASDVLNKFNTIFEPLSFKNISEHIATITELPLAKFEGGRGMPLAKGINPAWQKKVEDFRSKVVVPLFGEIDFLNEKEWSEISQKFNSFVAWMAEKTGAEVEPLGVDKVRQYIASKGKEDLLNLIEKDKSVESETNNIIKVDKLVRYYRDIYKLLKNFVTFYDFYSPHAEAIFQVGSLYIDQRSCDLCIRVSDMAKHSSMASSSGICLVYCDCTSKTRNEKMTVVAALTDGDIDNIAVGRNAIFYDRKGNDWDATIVKIIDNPISIRQAFWSPYRKISKFVSTQIEKIASAKDKEVQTAATAEVEKTSAKVDTHLTKSVQTKPADKPATPAPAPQATPAAAPQPFDIGKFVGIFAALSLALGAIGSVITSILTGFLSLVWWKMPLALIGIMLAVSGPSMFLAWLKLRKRNLAPVLDANGWAINARATINIPFGNTLTHLASLPKNSKLNLLDPFAKKRNPWIPVIIVIATLAGIAGVLWYLGVFKKFIG